MNDNLSGRELRVAAAKAMGYLVRPEPGGWYVLVNGAGKYASPFRRFETKAWSDVPAFESDPARLVEMFDWLLARGYGVDLYQYPNGFRGCYAWPPGKPSTPIEDGGDSETGLVECVARVVVAVGKTIGGGDG